MNTRYLLLAALAAAVTAGSALLVREAMQHVAETAPPAVGSAMSPRLRATVVARTSAPVVVVAYRNGCPHCLVELRSFADAHLPNDVQLVLVQHRNDIEDAPVEGAVSRLLSQGARRRIFSAAEIHGAFGTGLTPTIHVYDADSRLTKRFVGETAVADVLAAARGPAISCHAGTPCQ